jgi:D-3-phosphoglycerate dehydrogenase / 2-oxoglutarate reductase
VTYVNAPLLAKERGVEVTLTTSDESPDHRNLLTVRGTLAGGAVVSVSGTLVGPRRIEKLVEVDGFDVDLVPAEHMAFFRYHDRPGVVGSVGQLLGDAGVNIAGMQVSRDERGGHALMALTVDSAIGAGTLAAIVDAIGAESGRAVDLAD